MSRARHVAWVTLVASITLFVAACDAPTASPDAGADGGVDLGATPSPCTSNDACPDDAYCFGGCATEGRCHPRPESCVDAVPSVVCGCDGVTYPSGCDAAQAGTSIAYAAPCPPPPCELPPEGANCCFDDEDCGANEHCLGASCGEQGEGTCVSDELDPAQCWDNRECSGTGRFCFDAERCACGEVCDVSDEPGRCFSVS